MSETATESSQNTEQQTTPASQEGQQEQKAPTPTPAPPKAAEPSEKTHEEAPADETAEAKAARLEAEVTRLRRENGKERVTAKEKAANEAVEKAVKDMAVALGIIEAKDEAPDPAVLTQQIKAAQDQAKLAEVKLAVFQNAGDADPSRLLNFIPFVDAIKDIDATDTEGLKAAIKTATQDNPWLKQSTAPAAGKGGTELKGGTGEGAISKERFQSMSGKERNELFQSNPTLYNQLAGRE